MARTPIHTRTITVQVFDEGDGTISIEGSLQDVQPDDSRIFKQERRPGDPRPPGVVHHMMNRLTVDRATAEIVKSGGEFPGQPLAGCGAVLNWLPKLEGVKIAAGYTTKARELLGGPRGCAHMNTLLQVMANTRATASAYFGPSSDPGSGGLKKDPVTETYTHPSMNSCHMWRDDGPIVTLLKLGKNPVSEGA